MSLSSRGLARAALVSPGGPMFGLFQAIKSEWRPDYDEGISRLDVSENDLMLDVMSLTFKHISAGILSNCFSCADGTALSSSRTLLSSLAQFINRYFSPNVAVVEDQLIAGTGCSSLLEALAPVLCDPGDIVLTPGPMWPVSRLILGKSQVVLSPVVPSANSVDAILRWDDRLEGIWQDRIDDLVSTGKRPRAIILSNPQNPMGKCYSKAYLVGMMTLCQKNDLFLISDEVFALSQHEGDDGLEKFQSILSLNPERDAGCDPRRLIVLWSVSKDFGATASRVAVAILPKSNDALKASLESLSFSFRVSSLADAFFSRFLIDAAPDLLVPGAVRLGDTFVDVFVRENARRLQQAKERLQAWCSERNIPYVDTNYGHSTMISLGRYLGIGTTDSETESFALEGAFLSHLRSYQVLLQTGSSSHFPFAGWFRLTFSRTPQYMEVALSRLDNALKNWRPPKIGINVD